MNEPLHVLVTGCSSGIGRATALALARAGYQVHAGVRDAAHAAALVAAAPERIAALPIDLARPESLSAAAAEVDRRCGAAGLHALVNNAGVNLLGPFEYTAMEDARALLAVNFLGPAELTRHCIPLLRRAARGPGRAPRVVNVGSIGSRIGFPWESYYHASKFALMGHTEALRQELRAQRIAVSIVCPGGIRTPFLPKTLAGIHEAIARLPGGPEGRAYAQGLGAMAGTAALAERWGSKPERVADAIRRLLDARWPRFRTYVGADARLLRALHLLLTPAIAHRLWRSAFA